MSAAAISSEWKDAADVPPAERVADAALLIVDMQNDFVRIGAPLEVPDARATIEPIRRLIAAFRALGRPVVYTRFYARDTPELMWLWSRQCQAEVKCCWKGVKRTYADADGELECGDVIAELAPQPGEAVIDKFGYGSFHATDLDARLKALGVRSLLVTGTVAQICVEETAREAFHHGYRTTLISDGVSSFAPDLQAATLRNFAMKFGWVADSGTALGWLKTAGKS
ncbi:isochorismatase family cysteine hydrolase [Mesorhizobium sp. LHD-90]|uniref:cysteine hydrolase family protein n=1 Tax=Mesorhizobium sp. LHD-90 TaxID=3071414 RepID=UPI0027E1710B|nr:isochorismatase family cysteine hydrolase [Mesorhizobium sp. LHD-90]MDQ6434823.1 isochorismatase family cysteine hydrolase [Mesorhizobium sp. LHD-90]